jgi:polyisoprenoid-binding protein YceI
MAKAQSVINTTTGEIAVKVPIKSFVFENGLMQEHFNENYLESDKHPFATFKGKINESIDWTKPGNYPVSATGKLNLHGVERDQTIKGQTGCGQRQVATGRRLYRWPWPTTRSKSQRWCSRKSPKPSPSPPASFTSRT